jgi:ABC-type glycerol-3-phosphate transport system permease component
MCDANNFAFPLILPTSKDETKIVSQAFNQFSTIKTLRNETTFSIGLSGATIVKLIVSIAARRG